MKTSEIMFRKTFGPDKRLCFLAGKIRFHDVARLTARGVLFATICHYSPLFKTSRTIRTIRYSRLFAIRYSGFPDTSVKLVK